MFKLQHVYFSQEKYSHKNESSSAISKVVLASDLPSFLSKYMSSLLLLLVNMQTLLMFGTWDSRFYVSF